MWTLMLYFTLGNPAFVTLPTTYASQLECSAAAAVWTTKAANPQGTVARTACVGPRGPKPKGKGA